MSVGSVLTWLSSPKVNSMKKNRNDQNGERGSIVMAWGYTTNARPGPRGGKGQQGEKVVTELSMGGDGGEESSAEQHHGRNLPGLWQDKQEGSCGRGWRNSQLLAQTFIRHHLLLNIYTTGTCLPLPSPWPAEHLPSSLMLTPSGAFHPGRYSPQHTQAEGEGESIFIWPHLLLLPG